MVEPEIPVDPEVETEIVNETVVLSQFTGTGAGVQNSVGAKV